MFGKKIRRRRDTLVYVSGPYTAYIDEHGHHMNVERNIEIARKYAVRLWDLGYTVICPHTNTANFEEDCSVDYGDYLEGDFVIIERCDVVFMLPDWLFSSGAVAEKTHAKRHGIKIVHEMEKMEQYETD